MRTALDADPATLDEHETKFVNAVRKYGWFVTSVFDAEPPFSYTTGFWLKFKFPELILFSLDRHIAHDTFGHIFSELANGHAFSIGEPIDNVFKNLQGALLQVPKDQFAEYLGWSRWFYGGDDFQCVQLVWPDRNGRFPWQIGCAPDVIGAQADLTNWSTQRRH